MKLARAIRSEIKIPAPKNSGKYPIPLRPRQSEAACIAT